MRFSTILSIVISLLLAVFAVFAVRTYLSDQQARLAANADKPAASQTVVVALKSMRFGDRIRAENLKEIAWPNGETPISSFKTIAEIIGEEDKARYAMEAIDPGEPILTTKITGAGERATLSAVLEPGMKAVSIRVNDVLGVAGFIRPSDRVDVLLTRTNSNSGNTDQTFVDVLLQGVKVLAVDQTADERKDEPSVVKTVTFAVTIDEAQRLTLGASIGTLSLALRNVASSDVDVTRPITSADLGGGPVSSDLDKAANGDDERFGDIENLVKKVGDDLGQRINSVETKIKNTPKPEIKIVEKTVEKVIEPVAVEKPAWASIGVWNSNKREDYQVEQRE